MEDKINDLSNKDLLNRILTLIETKIEQTRKEIRSENNKTLQTNR